MLNRVKSKVSKINKQISRVMQSNMNPVEKRKLINLLSKKKLSLVERAVRRSQRG